MKLNFIEKQEVGIGNYPDLLHFFNNEAEVLYLQNGELFGKVTNTPLGTWENKDFEEALNISPDINMEKLEINSLSEFGAFGCYKTGNNHKLLIYELQVDVSEYLSGGSIKHSITSPISAFSLTLENPMSERVGHEEENIAISENASLISPGARVIFNFGMGDSEDYEMGTFYVDRSDFSLLSETVNTDGRNLIGKALKDQSFGENNTFIFEVLNEVIKKLLLNANVSPYKMLIENTDKKAGFKFAPKTEFLSGLEEIFKATLNWKIEEKTDGTIVVGSPEYAGFTTNDRYEFLRNKDIFSRQITKDDMEAYRRVCVHDSEFTIMVFKEVEAYSGWNLQSNKTLYVNIPEGTTAVDAEEYATELSGRLSRAGKVESFTGPFRPYITVGDEVVIIDDKGSNDLGLITEITHKFGKEGFYTEFTVDSGGVLGKGRLVDYISQITNGRTDTSRSYE